MNARVTFHPQEWVSNGFDKYAEPASDRDTVTFLVPEDATLDEDGEPLPDDSNASDVLIDHENAPDWVNDWKGPFYVTIERGVVESSASDH